MNLFILVFLCIFSISCQSLKKNKSEHPSNSNNITEEIYPFIKNEEVFSKICWDYANHGITSEKNFVVYTNEKNLIDHDKTKIERSCLLEKKDSNFKPSYSEIRYNTECIFENIILSGENLLLVEQLSFDYTGFFNPTTSQKIIMSSYNCKTHKVQKVSDELE